MDVFPVDVFSGGSQQKNSANKPDVLQERQVDTGLQEIKDGRNQYTEQD
jgi:ribosomal protein S3AE